MRFHIEGVRCQNCLGKIYELRQKLDGLIELHLNMSTKQLLVRIDKSKIKMSHVANEISILGYTLQPLQTPSESEKIQKEKNHRSLIGLGVAAASTGNIMLLSAANYAGADPGYVYIFDSLSFLLFLPILLYSAKPFWQSFLLFWKTKSVNIDLTIITAVVLGTGFSLYNLIHKMGFVYFDSMAMLLLLLLASRYMLDRIQQRYLNTNYLNPLLLETAVDVWLPESKTFENRPVKNLTRGDIIQVYKDQSLPVDGRLISENAYLNTAVITGESQPQKFLKSDLLFAGSKILSNKLKISVEKVGSTTRIGEYLKQLSDQIHGETQLTSKLNGMAKVFTISIIALASLLLIYFAPSNFSEGVQRALALVILACPCALGLAVPLTQSLALMKASRLGIIIKNGNVLHEVSKIQNFVFDKTGTLTYGQFEFDHWSPDSILTEKDFSIIMSLEQKARHPIGKAFTKYLKDKNTSLCKLDGWMEVFGKGVSGNLAGDFYEIKSAPIFYSDNPLLSSVGYYKNNELLAVAYFGDQIRPQSKSIIQKLKKRGNVFLLSGDNINQVQHLAKEVGIPLENVKASASPEEKVQFIDSLNYCAMIGDGANDAVAISKAHVGVAVQGSMIASLKAADVYFTIEGVEHLYHLFDVCEIFEKTVKGHMWFSALYNLLGALAAILGFINPLVAALLMPASSLTVLMTSLWGMKTIQLKIFKKHLSKEVLT
ncbi:MAG: cation-translocating P-type ATPase [Bdellovibrionaceae bacterium]|nr:cation-translocating P-type ATPase [Pseudobdellovibrionaceae bacterium]